MTATEQSEYQDVCVVTHPLGPAGENATRTLLEIISAITSVSLITAYLPEDSTIRNDHEVIEITDRSAAQSTILWSALRYIRNQFRMCRAISRRDEQIILFYGATAYLIPILWAKLLGRTVVLEPRGDVPLTLRLQWEERVPTPIARGLGGTVSAIEWAGYSVADAIITYTPSMAEELGLDRFESKLYPNGARYVDTETFYPRVPFEERENVVGFLGRLDEEKNVRMLAAVAKELPPDVTFRFIGDGGLRGELEQELVGEVVEGRVEFAGWVDHDDVPTELSELRLLVLPSEPTEGLPTVILESMACGTPVLATPVSGVPDVVRDGETGFLMEDTDRATVVTNIKTILQHKNLNEISENGRTLTEDEYSFEGAVERYSVILNCLLEK